MSMIKQNVISMQRTPHDERKPVDEMEKTAAEFTPVKPTKKGK